MLIGDLDFFAVYWGSHNIKMFCKLSITLHTCLSLGIHFFAIFI